MDHTSDGVGLDPLLAGYLTREDKALVAGVRTRMPETHELDWEQVERLALVHGVAPLLHEAWKDASGFIPAALLADLKETRQRTLRYSTVGMWQRDEVVGILHRAGIPCLVLKGAALARQWYGDLSLRSFSDIDLFLPAGDIDCGREALLAAGYEALPGGPGPHHDVPLRHPGLPCAVELHHRLTGIPLRHDVSFQESYTRSVEVAGEGEQIRTLAPEDTLLHLCVHMMSHVVLDRGWRLRHVCDIQRHVFTSTVDWTVFQQRATELGISRVCSSMLGVTSALTLLELPGDAGSDPATNAILRQGPTSERDDDTQHSGLYEFIAVLAVGDVRRAVAMVARDRVGVFDPKFGTSEATREPQRWKRRATVLLRQGIQLAGEVRRNPVGLSRQFRRGVGSAYRRQQQRRLVAELLSER